jgi:hypothetical protein
MAKTSDFKVGDRVRGPNGPLQLPGTVKQIKNGWIRVRWDDDIRIGYPYRPNELVLIGRADALD